MYAQVAFPLPFRNSFTYSIPEDLSDAVKLGVRVVVPFGKRILTGFVIGLAKSTDVKEKIKPIKDVLDELPIFDKESLKFYEWISEYYLSSLGEALKNSVPYGSDIESKRKVISDKDICKKLFENEKKKNTIRAKLLQKLSEKEVYKISQLQKELKRKNIYSVLRNLEKEGAVSILNEIENAKVRKKTLKFVKLSRPLDEIYDELPQLEQNSPKQVVILLEMLSNKEEDVQLSELLKKTKSSQSSVNGLADKKFLEIFSKEIERTYSETYSEKVKSFELTDKQKEIVAEISGKIKNNEFQSYLLHGVTGSGKTQVYIELTKTAVEQNKTALILVPEISLTPQITSRFYNNFGDKVAVVHSRMSIGERYDTWRGVVAGKFSVIIGPRSALFSPLKNIGLVVVDEEHDSSYKQFESVPKYNARDAAVIKASFAKCPVVLGSATPSLESMYNASVDKYKLLELRERVDNAKLPKIKLVDVTEERKKKRMEGVFSNILLKAIDGRLKKKEGVIILQNRRGFSTQIFCEDCGTIHMCPDCSVPMVYHLNKNAMQCHYCGIIEPVPKACPNCGSIKLKYFGTGTQKVEDELEFYFPKINVERVDSDAINKKGKLGMILNRFGKGETDLLVGTQMVSKGLDFSHVTLVGVISAETTLWLPDFRADERTFQLLTQVSGRSGRSKTEGEVIIQTRNHKNFVLQRVLNNDYDGFYQKEISLREEGKYPPFTRLGLIESRDQKEENARGAASAFYDELKKYSKGLLITPPAEAIIAKIKGFYRYQILIKSDKNIDAGGKHLRTAIYNSLIEFNRKSRYRDVRLTIDIDPQSIL